MFALCFMVGKVCGWVQDIPKLWGQLQLVLPCPDSASSFVLGMPPPLGPYPTSPPLFTGLKPVKFLVWLPYLLTRRLLNLPYFLLPVWSWNIGHIPEYEMINHHLLFWQCQYWNGYGVILRIYHHRCMVFANMVLKMDNLSSFHKMFTLNPIPIISSRRNKWKEFCKP
jgi:hypothetical protein